LLAPFVNSSYRAGFIWVGNGFLRVTFKLNKYILMGVQPKYTVDIVGVLPNSNYLPIQFSFRTRQVSRSADMTKRSFCNCTRFTFSI